MPRSMDAAGATADQNSCPQGQASSGGAHHTPGSGPAKGPEPNESAGQSQRFVVRGLKRRAPAPKGANLESEGSRRMPPSLESRGATRVTVLPDATRTEMLAAAGLDGSAHWRELDYMEQGASFGEACDLAAADEAEAHGFLVDGGWHIVEPAKGNERGGGTFSHRGVLQGDEHVDTDALALAVERELGHTIEEVRSVYRQGPLTEKQRGLRGQIDARLLALSRAGGQMLALARIFGWAVEEGGTDGGANCRTMERSVARAEAVQS